MHQTSCLDTLAVVGRAGEPALMAWLDDGGRRLRYRVVTHDAGVIVRASLGESRAAALAGELGPADEGEC